MRCTAYASLRNVVEIRRGGRLTVADAGRYSGFQLMLLSLRRVSISRVDALGNEAKKCLQTIFIGHIQENTDVVDIRAPRISPRFHRVRVAVWISKILSRLQWTLLTNDETRSKNNAKTRDMNSNLLDFPPTARSKYLKYFKWTSNWTSIIQYRHRVFEEYLVSPQQFKSKSAACAVLCDDTDSTSRSTCTLL